MCRRLNGDLTNHWLDIESSSRPIKPHFDVLRTSVRLWGSHRYPNFTLLALSNFRSPCWISTAVWIQRKPWLVLKFTLIRFLADTWAMVKSGSAGTRSSQPGESFHSHQPSHLQCADYSHILDSITSHKLKCPTKEMKFIYLCTSTLLPSLLGGQWTRDMGWWVAFA